MSYPTPLDMHRVNPNEDGYKELYITWRDAGKPRHFDALGIAWMQISDNEGICFIPTRPLGSGMDQYDKSSFSKINR